MRFGGRRFEDGRHILSLHEREVFAEFVLNPLVLQNRHLAMTSHIDLVFVGQQHLDDFVCGVFILTD